ncbi:Phosphatase YqaB [Edwardsiella hoshinae]|uniref:Phosphatase YqaB n=1 Tax=Edwardsiella hoshinae TaxID=93378 RepID=A0A376D9B9_9GAMM|nr:Phosphatase YqaB [Edwardsiella hoshinae]
MAQYDRYDGLIFDLDGTLLDSEPIHRQAWREVIGRHGMDYDLMALIALNGSPTWRIAQAIIEQNQSSLDPHLLAAEKSALVAGMLLEGVRPLPLSEVARAYKGRRPMAIGTGSEHHLADALLRRLGLPDGFRSSLPRTMSNTLCRSRKPFTLCGAARCGRDRLRGVRGCRPVSRRPAQPEWIGLMCAVYNE